MSDVSNARIDYPYVPRALLELCDFYQAESVAKPIIQPDNREHFRAILLLCGGKPSSLPDPMYKDCVVTKGRLLMLTPSCAYLHNINEHYKRLDNDAR